MRSLIVPLLVLPVVLSLLTVAVLTALRQRALNLPVRAMILQDLAVVCLMVPLSTLFSVSIWLADTPF